MLESCNGCIVKLIQYKGLAAHAGSAPETEFIVGTEVGLLHTLNKQNPDKKFYPASEELLCPDMKKITLVGEP